MKALVLYELNQAAAKVGDRPVAEISEAEHFHTLSGRVAKQASRQPRPDIREWPVGDGLEKVVDVMERSLANLSDRLTAVELDADRAGRTQSSRMATMDGERRRGWLNSSVR